MTRHRHYLKESLTCLNNYINKKEIIEVELNSNNDNEINTSKKRIKKIKKINTVKKKI